MDVQINYECEYKLDERVEIVTGIYSGRKGLFKNKDKDKYYVECEINGQKRLIQCSLQQLKRDTSIKLW
jgi:hypothetical protein